MVDLNLKFKIRVKGTNNKQKTEEILKIFLFVKTYSTTMLVSKIEITENDDYCKNCNSHYILSNRPFKSLGKPLLLGFRDLALIRCDSPIHKT